MAQFLGQYANVLLSGTAVPATGMALGSIDGGIYKTYQVSTAAHQVLDPQAAVTVKKNGSTESAALYTVNRLYGTVTFLSALLDTDVVTIDASYLPMTSVAGGQDCEINHQATALDATTFADEGWTNNVPGLQSTAGTIGRLFEADVLFSAALAAGSPMMVEFMRDATHVAYRAWALFTGDDTKGAVAELIGESVSWVGTTDADGRTVSYGIGA